MTQKEHKKHTCKEQKSINIPCKLVKHRFQDNAKLRVHSFNLNYSEVSRNWCLILIDTEFNGTEVSFKIDEFFVPYVTTLLYDDFNGKQWNETLDVIETM